MKTALRIISLALVLVIAVGVLASCGGVKLIGKWKYTVMGMTALEITFKAGGKGTMKVYGSSETQSFKWKVKGSKLSMTADGHTETMKFKVKGKTLTLDFPSLGEIELKKS